MSFIKKKYIFNISPTRVAGAISYFDKKKNKAVVEYFVEEKIKLENNFSLKDFRKETLKAIDKVCLNFIKRGKLMNGDYVIEDAEVFLTAPWVDYENYVLKHESLTPFKMDAKFLDNFILKKNNYQDREILSSDITSVKVNDYNVDLLELKNKEAQKISISFFDATILKFDKYFIDGAIKNHFPLLKINFSAFLPILFYHIASIYTVDDDFAFLDINSELTEFGIFRDGEIEKISSIPFGYNKVIVRIIDNGLVDNVMEAESILKLYLFDELEKELSEKIKKIIEDFISQIKFDQNELPPTTLVFSSKPEIRMILRKSNLFKNIYFIGQDYFDKSVEFIQNKFDNFIAAEVDYIYKK